MPTIQALIEHPVDYLEAGDTKRYWANDGVWGQKSKNTAVDPDLTTGPETWQYRQKFERALTVNEDGSVCAEWDLEWPEFNELGHSTDPLLNSNYGEVKTYPSWIYGQKPGYYSADMWPGYVAAIRAPDGVTEPVPKPSWTPANIKAKWQPAGGSVVQTTPAGKTPGSLLPLKLPLTGKTLQMRGRIVWRSAPTGRGHIAFDMFLSESSTQGNNFTAAPITHEIMIPLENWGNYGSHPNYRNPGWYDHDVTIDGVDFAVYCTKNSPNSPWPKVNGLPHPNDPGKNAQGYYPGLQYNFGGLNPNYTNEETGAGRIGWKFIIFQPKNFAQMKDADGYFNVNYIKFLEHLATSPLCVDSRGVRWIQGTEWVPSIEVGSEIVWGKAKYLIENYLVHDALTEVPIAPKPASFTPAPTPAPSPSPAPTPAPSPAPTPAPSPSPSPSPAPAPSNNGASMSGVAPVIPRIKFTNASGTPIAGGKVTVYYAGTTTVAPTYQDKDLTVANTSEITLDANGEALFWLNEAHSYKFLVKDSGGATVSGWPVDNVRGAGGVTSGVSDITVDRFSGTGAQTQFTLSTTPANGENSTEVYVSGVYIQKNAYSLAGDVLTFAVAPASGTNNIEVNTFGFTDYPAAATAVAASQAAAALSQSAAADSAASASTSAAAAADSADAAADSAATAGAVVLGNFLQAGTGAVSRTYSSKVRERISPEDFDSASATTTALTEIEAAWTSGVGVNIPTGNYTLESNLLLDANRMNLQGAGRHATFLQYNLAAAGPAITVNNPAAGGYNQGRLTDVAFSSSDSTAKTFLDLYNVANFEVARVATNSTYWPGDSIGIRARGRQLVRIHGSEIGCARPIVLSPNATFPTISTDHFLIEDCELVGSSATRDVIEVETGVSFSNTTFRHLALVQGRHGIYWNDTTSTAASFSLLIDEIRSEQGLDATAYSVYLASTAQLLKNVAITNSYLDANRNGIKLRNAQRVIIENVVIACGAGKTAIDITMVAGGRLSLRNVELQTGATVTITNGRCISKEVQASGAEYLYRNEEWIYDASTADGTEQSDVYHTGRPITVAASGTAILTNGQFVGKLIISSSEQVTGEFHCAGTSNQVKEISDPFGFFGIPGALGTVYNVKQDGSNNYIIENLRASPVTFYVYRIGYGQ